MGKLSILINLGEHLGGCKSKTNKHALYPGDRMERQLKDSKGLGSGGCHMLD